jgi:hypothetical protein
MAEEVMTKKEASAYLKISVPTLERWGLCRKFHWRARFITMRPDQTLEFCLKNANLRQSQLLRNIAEMQRYLESLSALQRFYRDFLRLFIHGQ